MQCDSNSHYPGTGFPGLYFTLTTEKVRQDRPRRYDTGSSSLGLCRG